MAVAVNSELKLREPCFQGKDISQGLGTYFSAIGQTFKSIFSSNVILHGNQEKCMRGTGIAGLVIFVLAAAVAIAAVVLMIFFPLALPISVAALALSWKIAAGVAGGGLLLTAFGFYGASQTLTKFRLE